jgi:hypothetical protein
MSTYDDMVRALREKKRAKEEEKVSTNARSEAAERKRRELIGSVLEQVHQMFFSAHQNDFDGLEMLHDGSFYNLKTNIWNFTVNGQNDRELVVARDPQLPGGKVVTFKPDPINFCFRNGEGGTLVVAQVVSVIVQEMLSWLQDHNVRVRG